MRKWLSGLTTALFLSAVCARSAEPKSVLIFSLTRGFRHADAIDKGNPIMAQIAEGLGYRATISEDPALLNPDRIEEWDCFIFNNTTGRMLLTEEAQRTAFMERIQQGGAGFMGFHSSTDCFYDWPAYGEMVNGYFSGHPWNQLVHSTIEEPDHPLMAPFNGQPFAIRDEIYQFRLYDRTKVRVLMSISPRGVDVTRGARDDHDYAICWIRPWGNGRVFYNAHGHGGNVFQDAAFQKHVGLAMQWACGDLDADTTVSAPLDAEKLAEDALAMLLAADKAHTEATLVALNHVAWRPSAEALPEVFALFEGEERLASAAASAANAICLADKAMSTEDKIEVLKAALPIGRGGDLQGALRKQLRDLGVTDLPIYVPAGYVAKWQAVGPIPNPEGRLFEEACPPEKGVDLMAGFRFGNASFSWREAVAGDDGAVDLNAVLGGGQDTVGYLYAEISMQQATDGELRLGSDDGFVLWLNGEKLGGKNVNRGFGPNQDRFKVALKAGRNAILMKVLQGGGDWKGGLQVVDSSGRPLSVAGPGVEER